ncbi:MAG: FAD-dependent thymidylate synthase, partial [Oscillospiraceae bacterium]|nr:FAD-dependent thymidylate synthase [Oscillospiraceae bacterium]
NFFRHRCCTRAQWEIRELADEMLRLVCEVAPSLFVRSGPPCVAGPCPEGKMSCGRMMEMREKYARMKNIEK